VTDSGVVNHRYDKELNDIVLHDSDIVPQAQNLLIASQGEEKRGVDAPHSWQYFSNENKDKSKFSEEEEEESELGVGTQ
jgi:hypothetical protein